MAYFRATVGSELDDPYARDLIAELSLKSDDFRRLWADHDVLSAVSGSDLYLHPAVGWMRLSFQTFAVGGTDRTDPLRDHRSARQPGRASARPSRQAGAALTRVAVRGARTALST